MQIQILKSKLHRAHVTDASLDYEGSLTIASDLMDVVDMVPHEKILVSNLANGNRFETYAIPGPSGSGSIILNGATAHLGKPGDLLTIMSFAWMDAPRAQVWTPRTITLGKGNEIALRKGC